MMNVSELKEKLNEFPDDFKVYLAVDEEGNGFHELVEAQISWIMDEGYEVSAIHPDDVGTEFDEADLSEEVILWP